MMALLSWLSKCTTLWFWKPALLRRIYYSTWQPSYKMVFDGANAMVSVSLRILLRHWWHHHGQTRLFDPKTQNTILRATQILRYHWPKTNLVTAILAFSNCQMWIIAYVTGILRCGPWANAETIVDWPSIISFFGHDRQSWTVFHEAEA